jgi:hypothetical protein
VSLLQGSELRAVPPPPSVGWRENAEIRMAHLVIEKWGKPFGVRRVPQFPRYFDRVFGGEARRKNALLAPRAPHDSVRVDIRSVREIAPAQLLPDRGEVGVARGNSRQRFDRSTTPGGGHLFRPEK